MLEIWKDIVGYENLYQISNFGNVLSLNYANKHFPKILKTNRHKDGYQLVGLSKNGSKKFFTVHKLVAQAFIPNPQNKEQINHIDGNKANNHVDNLEWVTPKENVIHAFKTGLMPYKYVGKSKSINIGKRYNGIYKSPILGMKGAKNPNHSAVLQYDLNSNLIKKWDCISDACRFYGITPSAISGCFSGRLKTVKGYIWKKPS